MLIEFLLLWWELFGAYSLSNFQICSIVLPIVPHAVHYIPRTCLFYNWKLYLPESPLWPLPTTNLFSNTLLFLNLNSVTFSSNYIIILCLSLEIYYIQGLIYHHHDYLRDGRMTRSSQNCTIGFSVGFPGRFYLYYAGCNVENICGMDLSPLSAVWSPRRSYTWLRRGVLRNNWWKLSPRDIAWLLKVTMFEAKHRYLVQTM